MAQTAKKPCSRGLALAKFLIFSGLGIFMFFVNVEINGKNVIIIQHIINFVKATCGHPVLRAGNGRLRRGVSDHHQGL